MGEAWWIEVKLSREAKRHPSHCIQRSNKLVVSTQSILVSSPISMSISISIIFIVNLDAHLKEVKYYRGAGVRGLISPTKNGQASGGIIELAEFCGARGILVGFYCRQNFLVRR
jgi:hypothetical protein